MRMLSGKEIFDALITLLFASLPCGYYGASESAINVSPRKIDGCCLYSDIDMIDVFLITIFNFFIISYTKTFRLTSAAFSSGCFLALAGAFRRALHIYCFLSHLVIESVKAVCVSTRYNASTSQSIKNKFDLRFFGW